MCVELYSRTHTLREIRVKKEQRMKKVIGMWDPCQKRTTDEKGHWYVRSVSKKNNGRKKVIGVWDPCQKRTMDENNSPVSIFVTSISHWDSYFRKKYVAYMDMDGSLILYVDAMSAYGIIRVLMRKGWDKNKPVNCFYSLFFFERKVLRCQHTVECDCLFWSAVKAAYEEYTIVSLFSASSTYIRVCQ